MKQINKKKCKFKFPPKKIPEQSALEGLPTSAMTKNPIFHSLN